jgi:hypothetical protein
MPYINGKQIKTYDLDTIDSFKIRIASLLNTLPEYLYFMNESSLSNFHNEETDIRVTDLLVLIKDSAVKNLSITDLIDNILEINKNINIKNSVLPIWFAYNKTLIDQYKASGELSLQSVINLIILKQIKNIDTSYYIKEIFKSNELNLKQLQDKIQKNKILDEENKKRFEYMYKTNECKYTNFDVEYVVSSLTLESTKVDTRLSLLELFNECILTTHVPFVTTQHFYKITNEFIPPDNWIESTDNSLILKVGSKNRLERVENYTDTIIKVDESITAEIMIYTNTIEGNVSKDEYTNRFLNVFKSVDLVVKESKESKVSGLFYFPNKKINKYIFSDLVMNDYLFNSFIKIDEHEGASKNKTYLFIQFYHPNTGLIKANMTQKISNKSNQPVNEDKRLFQDKSYYISVKIKEAVNSKSVLLFQTILGKLLTIYDEKSKDIIKFYSEYIKDFEEDEEEDQHQEEETVKKISEVAPEIFVSNYTRNCPPARMPIAMTEESINIAKKQGNSFIKFPRDIPESKTIRLSTDGVNQNSYICNTPPYKYIGLTKNKLKNADKYPYVPCCFKTDQTNKPKYLDYYKGQEKVVLDKTKDKDVIKTYKMLDADRFGQMPPNIDSLFTFMYPNQTHEYIRKGVFKNEHSFLNCVMEAKNHKNILSITDKEEREVILVRYRQQQFANKKLVALCRQEMYDYSEDKIINMLKDPHEYLDPKLFIHLLEDYFECNIFIFTKSNIFSDGEMILPRHSQAYYKNKNNYPCIYIYENLLEKQCELIVKYSIVKKEDPQYLFDYDDSKNVRHFFSKLRESYSLDKHIKEIKFPLPYNILSQYIDSYGKTRIVNITFRDNKLSLITSPIQPIKAEETKKQSVYKIPLTLVLDFLYQLNITLYSQTVVNDLLYQINFTLGNVKISIPIEETKKLDNIEEEKDLSFNNNTFSALEQYNKNKKIARYLMEYTIWLYSKYLHDTNINEPTNENIITFAKTFFLINTDFKYGFISKTFTLDSPLMENGLIVVHDIDTIKRLIYYLRLCIQRNTKNVIQYYSKTFIQNYYVDITDFNKHSNQIILFGDESIQNLINENNIKYTINNYIQIGLNIPYFFKNKLIDNKVYLAQNSTSIEKAYDIATTWNTDGYNKGIFAENRKPVSFNLYSYTSAYNIKKHSIKTTSSSQDIKILGYKIEDKPYYTVLLSLS